MLLIITALTFKMLLPLLSSTDNFYIYHKKKSYDILTDIFLAWFELLEEYNYYGFWFSLSGKVSQNSITNFKNNSIAHFKKAKSTNFLKKICVSQKSITYFILGIK